VVAVGFRWSLGAIRLGRRKCHSKNILHGPVEGLVGRLLEVAPRELNTLSRGENPRAIGQFRKVVDNTLGSGFYSEKSRWLLCAPLQLSLLAQLLYE
jgi:hypothetical protein